jgi:hypothetical protein
MKAVFKSSYPKNGNEIFVFTVKGNTKEIEDYLKDNPQAVTDETSGLPLFFTAYPTLDYDKAGGVELYRSRAGKYSLDNSEMRRAQALSKTFKAEEQFATKIVDQITGKMFGTRTASVVSAADIADEVAEVVDDVEDADLDNV